MPHCKLFFLRPLVTIYTLRMRGIEEARDKGRERDSVAGEIGSLKGSISNLIRPTKEADGKQGRL